MIKGLLDLHVYVGLWKVSALGVSDVGSPMSDKVAVLQLRVDCFIIIPKGPIPVHDPCVDSHGLLVYICPALGCLVQ